MPKNNFILYKDFKPNIDILTDEQAGKLIKAVFAYVDGRIEPNFDNDGMLKMAFLMLKTTLERDLKKYKEQVKRNQENGKKGGRPPSKGVETHSVIDEPTKPTGLNKTHLNRLEPKKADSDSVIDSDIDNVIKKESKKKKTTRFIKPTIEELNDYKQEKEYKWNVEAFYDYYETNGWKVGKNAMKDWKAAMRNWDRRNSQYNTTTKSNQRDASHL